MPVRVSFVSSYKIDVSQINKPANIKLKLIASI